MSIPDCYYISQETAFGHTLVRRQWPLIVTQAIDNLNASVAELNAPESAEAQEAPAIISKLEDLKAELESNAKLVPMTIPENYPYNDLKEYNDIVANLHKTGSEQVYWKQGAWLVTECYFYRRLIAIFQASKHWSNYDCFTSTKRNAFQSSRIAVIELAVRYQQISKRIAEENLSEHSPENVAALEKIYKELVDHCLWGNSIDLALLAELSHEELAAMQGEEARKANESKVLVNDTQKVWNYLSARKQDRIDFVLDNAGFELYTDVVLSLFLLDAQITKSVVFQPKTYPCFVSDVLNQDFDYLLNDLNNPTYFGDNLTQPQIEALQFIVTKFKKYQEDKTISLHNHIFWNTHYQFNRDLSEFGRGGGAEAWKDLKDSDFVFFKGDMNHRKLLGDLQWERTTPFPQAIALNGTEKHTLGNSGIPLVSFRTIKSNPLTGLPKGLEEKMNEMWWNEQGKQGDKKVVEQGWAFSTKWAVIEFSNGKPE